jgi:hypothetical protein
MRRSRDGRTVGQSIVAALGPALDIVLVDRSSLGWLLFLHLMLCHCDGTLLGILIE